MCRNRHSGSSLPFLLLTLLFYSVAIAPAQGTSEPGQILSAQSTPPVSPLTISGWQSFDEAWMSLKTELTASDEDWARLLISLQSLQIVASELQLSLLESTALLKSSEEALQAARDERDRLNMHLSLWRGVAATLGGIAGILGLILIVF